MNKQYNEDSFLITSAVLNINPELNVAWNFRRNIILNYYYNQETKLFTLDWDKELQFTMVQLKKFPKVYWIWGYRTWCLLQIDDLKYWKVELHIIEKLLEMDSRNFHGWAYRRFVNKQITLLTGQENVNCEFEYTTQKINSNFSNFSAWHQRAQLFPLIFNRASDADGVYISVGDHSGKYTKMIDREIDYLTNGIFTDCDDQSIWIYLKWFIKQDFVISTLQEKNYTKMLQKFVENIEIINNDELDFKETDNPWCLKLLVFIEDILINDLHIQMVSQKENYIKRLIKVDPLRKNRYLRLLNAHV